MLRAAAVARRPAAASPAGALNTVRKSAALPGRHSRTGPHHLLTRPPSTGARSPCHIASTSFGLAPFNYLSRSRAIHSCAYVRSKAIEDIYQKKTPREHVLARPETYIGPVDTATAPMWTIDPETSTMVQQEITFVPGLYKIFDEILVNAADNRQRDSSTTVIRVTIDPESGRFTIFNNGKGVPIEKHKVENMYVPEMVFGHLLTGSNFDDADAKVTGGRNGYGAKLCNIFSREFTVETVDAKRKLRYVQMDEDEKPLIARVNKRWQIAVSAAGEEGSAQVSFVNSIWTARGGQHVQYIMNQIVEYLVQRISRKEKDVTVTPQIVRNNIFLFVNCLIENPAFDSQTKETLTTKPSNFGSHCNLPESLMRSIATDTTIVTRIVENIRRRQQLDLNKAPTMASKLRTRLIGIPKLEDANDAGGPRSSDCTLILTEGDSAKALAVSGLTVLGRDHYGVFPLKGKLLNVRDAAHKSLMDNVEITHLKTILGLSHEKSYETPEERATLRYGRVMLMTDQDHDGSHIKGLFINFIHHFWPALLQSDDFLEEFVTPIVKASKGKEKMQFFTLHEYEKWKADAPGGITKWHTKYYKGLGTNTSEEAKEYFKQLDKHKIKFRWTDTDDNLIKMAFSKSTTMERKDWIRNWNPEFFVDHQIKELSYSDFINKELVLFSRYDTLRCIPNVVDGLKPGQRKVLFACFRRKLDSEIKVAQLAGYVSEHTGYHHGEASLHSTIVNMAQDFVGSNNVPLLVPSGQFGTRLEGGKDAASARYIFTYLNPTTRLIFPELDDPLLKYLDEDGTPIEPEHYVPIIPMVLVNGTEGLGVGWSTFVPAYSPLEIVDNVLRKIDGEEMLPMAPYYRGFKGTIEQTRDTQYITTGVMQHIANADLRITELPVHKWTNDYKLYLDELASRKGRSLVKDYREHHTNEAVHFELTVSETLFRADQKEEALLKRFKLQTPLSTNNMHLFNAQGVMTRYNSPLAVIEDFYTVRKGFYEKRRAYLIAKLQDEVTKLRSQHQFNKEVIAGKIQILNRKKDEILAKLEAGKFHKINNSFDYLLSTPLLSLTEERVAKLQADKIAREEELKVLQGKDAADLWKEDLLKLKAALEKDEALVAKRKMEEERNADRVAALGVSKKSKRSSKKVSRRRKAPVEVEEEEEEIEEDEE